MRGREVLMSSKSGNWLTPPEVFEPLNEEFPFLLDACTTESNPLDLPNFYTPKDNGLLQPWTTWTFFNPPYRETPKWVAKAISEQQKGNGSVGLLPARVDAKWFHKFLYNAKERVPRKGIELRFIEGRVRFFDPATMLPATHTSTFPSMVAVIRPV